MTALDAALTKVERAEELLTACEKYVLPPQPPDRWFSKYIDRVDKTSFRALTDRKHDLRAFAAVMSSRDESLQD